MKNRLYIVAAAIVVGLVYLINAQEKPLAPPSEVDQIKVTPALAPASAPAVAPASGVETAQPMVGTPATSVTLPEVIIPKSAQQTPAAPAPKPPAPAAAAPKPQPVVKTIAAPETEFVSLPEQKEADVKGAFVEMKTNETLSIALDDVEMVDVIRMFTRLSKANIIVDPSNLVGKVTVNLADVEWKPALTSILDMHNLSLIEKTPASGVFSIVPKIAGAQEPLVVETMFLKYASVSNVEAVVKSMAPPPGSVSVFASRNAMVVRATSAQISEIKQTLKNIDTLREQVFIEAKFMELNDEAIKDLGINWQVLQDFTLRASSLTAKIDQNKSWDASNNKGSKQWDKRSNVDKFDKRYDLYGIQYEDIQTTFTTIPVTPPIVAQQTTKIPTRTIVDTVDKGKELTSDIADNFKQTASDVRAAVLGVDDFKIMLSALKQMNGVSIISNPKIMVANEEAATIHIGQERRPFISNLTPGQQGIAPVVTYNPGTPVLTGVKLTVTPTVNTSSNISVKIEPEITRISGEDRAPNGQTYPIVATKKIKTVFCLESGKTVAIGGLTEITDQDNTKKIPLLGDIPLIGKYLFSWTHQEKGQTETIIFVTVGLALPESVEADSGLPADTELAQRKMLESKLKSHKNKQALEQKKAETNAAIDGDTEKTKSRLLRMNK